MANKEYLFDFFDWTVLGLFGSFFAGAIPTLLLFYVGFRYEADFIPSLTLLALIGFCQLYMALKNAAAQKVAVILGWSLAILSIYLNIALSYSGVWG